MKHRRLYFFTYSKGKVTEAGSKRGVKEIKTSQWFTPQIAATKLRPGQNKEPATPTWMARTQVLGPSVVFPGVLARIWIRSATTRTGIGTHMGCQCGKLSPLHTTAAPTKF